MHLSDDIVILVHGTFVKKDTPDVGPSWWQRGSEAWQWFDRNLPKRISLPDSSMKLFRWNGEDSHVFRWSGENSQADRLKAGNELLALLLGLEQQGRGYHLVGHSHGGSIIWEALISAEVTRETEAVGDKLRRELNDPDVTSLRCESPWFAKFMTFPPRSEFEAIKPFIELEGLRSWTTVGTPFLHYLPRRRLFAGGWPHHNFSLNPSPGQVAKSEIMDRLLLGLIMAPLSAVGVGLLFFPGILRSFLGSPLGGLAWAVFSVSSVAFFGRYYADSLIERERYARGAMDRFYDRWLGLWAPEDEAITGLKGLTQLPDRYDYEWLCTSPHKRPKYSQPDRNHKEDAPGKFELPKKFANLKMPITDLSLVPDGPLLAPIRIMSPVIIAYNTFVAPMVMRIIQRLFIRMAQGADLPHALLAYASPWPLPLAGIDMCSGLPENVSKDIQKRASATTSQLGLVARELFMQAALEGIPSARNALQIMGLDHLPLVHTSYFDDENVRRLIARHMRRMRAKSDDTLTDDHLSKWLKENSDAIRTRLNQFRALEP